MAKHVLTETIKRLQNELKETKSRAKTIYTMTTTTIILSSWVLWSIYASPEKQASWSLEEAATYLIMSSLVFALLVILLWFGNDFIVTGHFFTSNKITPPPEPTITYTAEKPIDLYDLGINFIQGFENFEMDKATLDKFNKALNGKDRFFIAKEKDGEHYKGSMKQINTSNIQHISTAVQKIIYETEKDLTVAEATAEMKQKTENGWTVTRIDGNQRARENGIVEDLKLRFIKQEE